MQPFMDYNSGDFQHKESVSGISRLGQSYDGRRRTRFISLNGNLVEKQIRSNRANHAEINARAKTPAKDLPQLNVALRLVHLRAETRQAASYPPWDYPSSLNSDCGITQCAKSAFIHCFSRVRQVAAALAPGKSEREIRNTDLENRLDWDISRRG